MFKKIMMMFMIMGLISGCVIKEEPQKKTEVYSFYGDSDFIQISNGVIVIELDDQIFSGGHLNFKKPIEDKVVQMEKKFYVQKEDAQKVIADSKVIDDHLVIEQKVFLPSITGEMFQDFDYINDQLIFELTLVFENGNQETYRIDLNVKDITTIRDKK